MARWKRSVPKVLIETWIGEALDRWIALGFGQLWLIVLETEIYIVVLRLAADT